LTKPPNVTTMVTIKEGVNISYFNEFGV